ncbi:MAG TPA: type II toxin-antitoxin system Phd/YefM family antitoxin [Thermomicrobiales bacterium]|nr:type II toxin-antitoxin system Phd/YefM family antitoxin [Thermomicrobiales bacterium]
MVKTISTAKARASFGDVVNAVYYTKEPVVVEKKGRPVAVIVNPEEYEALERAREAQAWALIEAVGARNADKDPDELMADVTAEVEAVRQEMYDERTRR